MHELDTVCLREIAQRLDGSAAAGQLVARLCLQSSYFETVDEIGDVVVLGCPLLRCSSDLITTAYGVVVDEEADYTSCRQAAAVNVVQPS